MLEPPDLPEDRIVGSVLLHYGLRVTELTFLPLGQDVLAWTYRAATATGAAYFLKLSKRGVNEAALRVPRYLADHGVPYIVAPTPTRAGPLYAHVDGFTLTLYPFISGSAGAVHGLEERHWVTFGAALRAIHDTRLTPDLEAIVPRESFSAELVKAVQTLDAWLATRTSTDAIERDAAAFWQLKRAEIMALVSHFERFGEMLRKSRPKLVLCHADLHPNNVLIDTGDRFWVVDWDDTRLAPRECDLMMGVGGLSGELVGRSEEAWFLRGYGDTAIDPVALAYYRHVRAVGDIGAYGEQIFTLPSVGEATRRRALYWLQKLFAPGYIVSLANQAERAVS